MKLLTHRALLATGSLLLCHNLWAEPTTQQPPLFDLLELQVDGNSVLDADTIEKTVYPFLGPNKSIDTVEQARQALESVYKARGYPTVLVEIPEQDVVEGLVKLAVVEGTIERLKISGSRYYSLGKISDQVPALAAGTVPHIPTVQKQITALGKESADRQVTPIFRAGSTPGKTEVELKVKDELPLHGSLEINGNNSESTSRTRMISSVRYDNLWQKFHSASLQFQVSPENANEVEVWSGTYVMPTGWENTHLALYGIGISSNTQLGASVGGMSVVGTGSIYGARLMAPLDAIDNYDHNLIAGLDYKNFDQVMTLQGQDNGHSPVSYPAMQFGYDSSLHGSNFETTLSSSLHFLIRGLGTSDAEFAHRRCRPNPNPNPSAKGKDKFDYCAKPNYFYLNSELKHLQQLPLDTQILARFAGQVANGMLISNEQYAAGGFQTVRGYHQTQQLGDDGFNLSFELQSPQLSPASWSFVDGLRAHAFIDYAYLNVQKPLKGNPSFYRLAGAGMGLRWQLIKHLSGEFDWAYPLYRQSTVNVGDQRVDFRLAYEF
jgi:hemolysin activation/secretion protein